jgi:F0F1-type ATP synthase membrane subunit b/b'
MKTNKDLVNDFCKEIGEIIDKKDKTIKGQLKEVKRLRSLTKAYQDTFSDLLEALQYYIDIDFTNELMRRNAKNKAIQAIKKATE